MVCGGRQERRASSLITGCLRYYNRETRGGEEDEIPYLFDTIQHDLMCFRMANLKLLPAVLRAI